MKYEYTAARQRRLFSDVLIKPMAEVYSKDLFRDRFTGRDKWEWRNPTDRGKSCTFGIALFKALSEYFSVLRSVPHS